MADITLSIEVEETHYDAPSEWRIVGGQGKAEHVVALCEKNALKPQTLLEVGAGEGAILRHLGSRSFCPAMHAVEVSESGVRVIRDQDIPGLISCNTFDGYRLPFPDDSFDLVILSHVLEHVEFERALLREIRRVSRYQVIEIPMDFPALRNEPFHSLGPSYGHINAHAPESLKFLLSTEGFRVLDDMLGRYSLAVQEYDHFTNNNRAKTPQALQQFRNDFSREEEAFAKLPAPEKVRQSSYYAVLAKREEPDERLSRALCAAKAYIDGGQIQPARLIFKHYVQAEQLAGAAAEMAEHCRDKGHGLGAREFSDLALAAAPSESVAARIKDVLKTVAS